MRLSAWITCVIRTHRFNLTAAINFEMRKRLVWVQLYESTADAGLVCRQCGISYPTLRKWVRRYRDAGRANRGCCPTRSPNRRIFEHERALILGLRRERKLGVTTCQAATPVLVHGVGGDDGFSGDRNVANFSAGVRPWRAMDNRS